MGGRRGRRGLLRSRALLCFPHLEVLFRLLPTVALVLLPLVALVNLFINAVRKILRVRTSLNEVILNFLNKSNRID